MAIATTRAPSARVSETSRAPALALALRAAQPRLDPSQVDFAVATPGGTVIFPGLHASVRQAVALLDDTTATPDELTAYVLDRGGSMQLPYLYHCLDTLHRLAALTHVLREGDREIARVVVMVPHKGPDLPPAPPVGPVVLSRFALIRRDEGGLVVESPLSYARITLHDPDALTVVGRLSHGGTISEIAADVTGLADETIGALVALFHATGMSTALDGAGGSVEDDDIDLRQWSLPDLLFHARSRAGRHDDASGATYPLREVVAALPAVKPAMSATAIPLYQPDVATLVKQDTSFTDVIERRKSIRRYGPRLVTAREVGEFLYRAARVRRLREPSGGLLYPGSSRPYPGGGACYELEIYPAVLACDGLDPGLYHYDPLHHQLEVIAGGAEHVATFFSDQYREDGPRQLLFVITARFRRIRWKYEAMAYAATLKNAGVLLHNFYLVATAMGLAPCAVGAGNADHFADIIGTAYHAESSVAEFMLGTVPEPA